MTPCGCVSARHRAAPARGGTGARLPAMRTPAAKHTAKRRADRANRAKRGQTNAPECVRTLSNTPALANA